jgi:hypothetical protein
MIKVKPYLPEPSGQPSTFLADPADRLFAQGWLFTRSIKIDDSKKPILGAQYMINSVQGSIKTGNLVTMSSMGKDTATILLAIDKE